VSEDLVRARRGWIAVALLFAIAFLAVPDPLDSGVRLATEASARTHHRPRCVHLTPDRDTPSRRLLLPGLPPPSQNHMTASARAVTAEPAAVPAKAAARDGRALERPADRSPETLQIFRC
jgi:hypothetical protein